MGRGMYSEVFVEVREVGGVFVEVREVGGVFVVFRR
jgi:hypothetical protein